MSIDEKEVLEILGGRGRPELTLKAILARLRRQGHEERGTRRALRSLLREMLDARQIERTRAGYRLGRRDQLVEGTFIRPPDDVAERVVYEGDVLDDLGERWRVTSAVPLRGGERVAFQPAPNGERQGDVLRCLGGDRDHRIGIFEAERGGGGSVRPYRDDTPWRVRVAKRDRGGARPGEVVAVEPLAKHGPLGGRTSSGRVVECLGMPGEAEADYRAVAWRHRLPLRFPEDVLAEAERIDDGLDPKEIARRLDLRDRAFITIDPSDARDHDDAVFVEPPHAQAGDDEDDTESMRPRRSKSKAGSAATRLWVAIADVAHYVPEGSALDREAQSRGNSVYFPRRVIPMLPERISGDLCSLRPDRDRLAMVVELRVDRAGAVEQAAFHAAVIRSRARLSYSEAAAVIDAVEANQEPAVDLPCEIVEQLRLLGGVARRLAKRRFSSGSIDFDVREGRVELDDDGAPKAIVEVERTGAHRAIEDAMLAANRAVADRLCREERPCIYRIHERPDPAKLEALREIFETFGLIGGPRDADARAQQEKTAHEDGKARRKPGEREERVRRSERRRARPELSPLEVHRALQRARGHAEERLVNLVALRSMKQARYSHENSGHFALGFGSYLHFTSPIRRYADLVVHRRLKESLSGRRGVSAHDPRAITEMQRVAKRVSFRERVAVEAEREILDLKKCAFMARYVGVELDGIVSGVSIHGVFVTLDDFYVDGLVHATTLSEELRLDERLHQLVGRRSGHRYRLGDPLRIRVEAVDLIRGWIRFVPTDPVIEGASRRGTFERSGSTEKKKKGPKGGKPGRFKSGRRSGPRSRRRGAPTRGRGRR